MVSYLQNIFSVHDNALRAISHDLLSLEAFSNGLHSSPYLQLQLWPTTTLMNRVWRDKKICLQCVKSGIAESYPQSGIKACVLESLTLIADIGKHLNNTSGDNVRISAKNSKNVRHIHTTLANIIPTHCILAWESTWGSGKALPAHSCIDVTTYRDWHLHWNFYDVRTPLRIASMRNLIFDYST